MWYSWKDILQQRDLLLSSSLEAVEFQGMQSSLAAFEGMLRVKRRGVVPVSVIG